SARCDSKHAPCVAKICHKGGIPAVNVGIVFRSHISATSPGFVTDPPKLYIPGVWPAVLFSEVGHRALSAKVDVLDPICDFLYGTTAYIYSKVWFCTQQFT